MPAGHTIGFIFSDLDFDHSAVIDRTDLRLDCRRYSTPLDVSAEIDEMDYLVIEHSETQDAFSLKEELEESAFASGTIIVAQTHDQSVAKRAVNEGFDWYVDASDGGSRVVDSLVAGIESLIEEAASTIDESDLLNRVPVPVFAVDADHEPLVWNDAMEEMTDRRRSEVFEAKDLYDPFYGEERPLLADLVVKEVGEDELDEWYEDLDQSPYCEGGYIGEGHYTAVDRWLQFAVNPIEDGSGTVVGAIEALLDITPRKRRERELERYATLVQASGDPVYTLDADGRLTFANDALIEMSGYERDEMLGERVSTVMRPEDAARGRDLIAELLASERSKGTFELEVITADGDVVQCENHLAILPFEDEFKGTVGILRDITKQKRRERELERQNDRLDQLASVVSHDLRNPLNIAKGRLDLASEECESEQFEHVQESLDRMENLIKDVLTLARSGRSIGETREIELAEMAQSCWDMVETPATASLEVTDSVVFEGDETRVRSIFENFYRNAIEHASTSVTVTVSPLEDGFAVEDDGPGIPDDGTSIFEAGYSTKRDGTGFGLNIVKEIVDAHGWSIAVVDGATGGARFEISGVETPS